MTDQPRCAPNARPQSKKCVLCLNPAAKFWAKPTRTDLKETGQLSDLSVLNCYPCYQTISLTIKRSPHARVMLLKLSAKVWIYHKRGFPKSGRCNIAAGVCFISFRFPEKWGYPFQLAGYLPAEDRHSRWLCARRLSLQAGTGCERVKDYSIDLETTT